MGDQRHQDLEQRSSACHPRVAVRTYRSECCSPPRHLGHHRPDRHPRRPDPPAVRVVGLPHQRSALPGRAGASHQSGRRGQPRLDLHHRSPRSGTRCPDQCGRPASRCRRVARAGARPRRDGTGARRHPSAAAPIGAGRSRRSRRHLDGLRGRLDPGQRRHSHR